MGSGESLPPQDNQEPQPAERQMQLLVFAYMNQFLIYTQIPTSEKSFGISPEPRTYEWWLCQISMRLGVFHAAVSK